MNILLQIGLGLLPGTVGAIFFLIKRRAIGFKKILFTLLLTIGCGTSIFFGASGSLKEIQSPHTLSQKELIEFAYALYSEGAYTQLDEVIDQYSRQYGYDDNCRLIYARVAMSEADYERAAALYDYLCNNTSLVSAEDNEVVFARSKASASVSDLITINYLTQSDAALEDYGYTQDSYETISSIISQTSDDVSRNIFKNIEKNYPISALASDYARMIVELDQLTVEPGDEDNKKILSDYKDGFKEIEKEHPEYLTLPPVQNARIKTYIMSEDYSGFVKSLDGSSSYQELMVASELYMDDLVSKSNFSDEFRKLNPSQTRLLKQALSKIYQNAGSGLNKQERKQLKARVNALTSQLGDIVLLTIKDELVSENSSVDSTDTSKVLLQAAKIDNYFGNETSAQTYIQAALNTSQNSDDKKYSSAMLSLMSVIDNTEVSDEIKNVPKYVGTALDHSLPVRVEPYIAAAKAANSTTSDSDESQPDFSQTAINYVSRVKSSIFIGSIDSSEFENITARVQIDCDIKDIDELKAALKIYDCNKEITDYELKKIDFKTSYVLLLCDVSGSMGGSIEDLRNAVTTFINEKNSDENLAVATFSNAVGTFMDFNTPDDDLVSLAQSMYAEGGTEMFSAAEYCLNQFTAAKDENNVLILMTDGQDNFPHSYSEIYETLGTLASQNNVTIYTMGLGSDVDTSYLNTIAGSGNGEFVYVSDSASLTAFYDMLHSQMYSQYELTYKVLDTTTGSGRTLEVAFPSKNLRDIKTYSVGRKDEEGADITENNAEKTLTVSDMLIFGLAPYTINKPSVPQDIPVKLKGNGFSKDYEISIKLSGETSYTLTATYENEQTYNVIVPSNIAIGTYNVEIVINGNKKYIPNGFQVFDHSAFRTTFGKYVFTSMEKNVDGTTTILNGNVTLNDWLHFKGHIELRGDLENDGSITVYDSSGSYVSFDPVEATGFAKYLANQGTVANLPKLDRFTLYNDTNAKADESDYLVDDISTGSLSLLHLVTFDNINIRLYPNHIGIYHSSGELELPGMKKWLDMDDKKAFEFDFGNISIDSKNVGIKFSTKLQNDQDKLSFTSIKGRFFNNAVHFNGHLSVDVDTYKNEYSVGGLVRFAMLARQSGFGAKVTVKQTTVKDNKTGKENTKLVADSVELSVEPGVPIKLPTVLPVTIKKFSGSASDIKSCVENNDFWKINLTGKFSLSCGDLKEDFPKIASITGINSVFEMPDTTFSLKFSPFKISAEAKFNILDDITIAKTTLQVGVFNYTNSVLGLNSEEVKGLSASVSTGLTWQSKKKNVYADVSGKIEFDGHTEFIGIVYDGTAKYDINWWLFNFESKKESTGALGFHLTKKDNVEFILKGNEQDSKGKNNGFYYYIDKNGAGSSKSGKLN